MGDFCVLLSQNVWKIYGLKGNPFDVRALSLVSETLLPISKAFVGRSHESKESQIITNLLRNPGGACVAIEGDIGVGKTTFVNYHRFLWENEALDKLFTPIQEIGLAFHGNIKNFMMNILDSLICKIMVLSDADAIMKKVPLFQEILILSKVYFKKNLQIEGGAFGFNFGVVKNEFISVPEVSENQLLWYFQQMVQEIKKLGYAGIFLHFDNLEVVARQETTRLRLFFEQIRDILQTPDVYFIFVSYRGFFSEIITPLERVRSIFFGYPIYISPLKQEEVIEAIEKRYSLLSNGSFFCKPIEDAFIIYLYKLFKGKIRFIMDSINTLVPNLVLTKPITLTCKDACQYLLKMTKERLNSITQKEREILEFAAHQETFTNQKICQTFHMPASNVTRTLQSLQQGNLIYPNHQAGKYIYYCISEELRIIQENTLSQPESFPYPKSNLSIHDKAIQFLQSFSQKEFTAQEYQKAAGIAASTARLYLNRFLKQGIICRKGKGRATRYQNSPLGMENL